MFCLTARRRRVCAEANSSPLEEPDPTGQAVTKERTIMTTTNGTPVEEASMELRDAMNWAADIVNTAINMRAHTSITT